MERLLGILPRDFPPELKMQIARSAAGPLATKIYQDVSTREGRFELAKLQNDVTALKNLIRETKDDDVALESARLLVSYATAPQDQIDVAQVFFSHRQFDPALMLYQQASTDSSHAADARFQIG